MPNVHRTSAEETAAWDAEDLSRLEATTDITGVQSDACYFGNHSTCKGSDCGCAHHTDFFQEYSGACADEDHGACRMSHGTGKDDCWCPDHGTVFRSYWLRRLKVL